MNLRDRITVFHLSAQGQQALLGLVPGGASFEALVLDADNVGSWVIMGRGSGGEGAPAVPVLLIKWEHVAAVAFEQKIDGTTDVVTISI